MIGIYYIENPEGKVYVGQSRNVKKRLQGYSNLNCKGQPKLYESLKKFGWDSHYKVVLEICKLGELNERERYWQEKYKVLEEGLNDRLQSTKKKPTVISEEHRKNYIAAAKKRGNNRPKGSYSHSKDTIVKIRKSNLGQVRSLATRKEMSMAKAGNPLSKKHREAISKGGSCTIQAWDLEGNLIKEFPKIGDLIKWMREEKGSCSDGHIRKVLKGERDSYKRMRFTSEKWNERNY